MPALHLELFKVHHYIQQQAKAKKKKNPHWQSDQHKAVAIEAL